MLSVSESAHILGVSPSRVRALIKSGDLYAKKNGREWILTEEDVYERLATSPKAGRPTVSCNSDALVVKKHKTASVINNESQTVNVSSSTSAHGLYKQCKKIFNTIPTNELLSQAKSDEETSFYFAVSDYFLKQKQLDLIKAGVY